MSSLPERRVNKVESCCGIIPDVVVYVGFLLFILFPQMALSLPTSRHFFGIELGAYHDAVVDKYASPSNVRQEVGALFGIIRIKRAFTLSKRFTFDPSVGGLFPWSAGSDGTARKFIAHTSLDMGANLFSFLKFRLGPGVQMFWLVTEEQDIELQNGTSTSTFYVPGGTVFGALLTVQTALEIRLHQRWYLNLELHTLSIASRERRRFNVLATLGFIL